MKKRKLPTHLGDVISYDNINNNWDDGEGLGAQNVYGRDHTGMGIIPSIHEELAFELRPEEYVGFGQMKNRV